MPWPGYLVGGPHSGNLRETNGDPIAPANASCASAAVCYFDYYADYARNEIAINWNGSMIYALSGFVSAASPPTSIAGRNAAMPAVSPQKAKATRMIQVRNGRSSIAIPPGAKVYSLDGRLVARRKAGDAGAPVINRNGMFIMKMDAAVSKDEIVTPGK
jgi:hypothetical protein